MVHSTWRQVVTDGIGDIHRTGSGVDDRFQHPAEKIQLGTARVLGRELDIVGVLARPPDRLDGLLHHLVRLHAQFLFHMNGRGGDEGVDTRRARLFQRLTGAVDVALQGARQSAYGGILHRPRNCLHGLEIAGTGNREAGLDNVDPHALQRPGDAHLLVFGHGCAGALLAVAQGGVEYDQTIAAHDLLHRGLRRLLRPQHTKEARRVRIDYSRVSGCCV